MHFVSLVLPGLILSLAAPSVARAQHVDVRPTQHGAAITGGDDNGVVHEIAGKGGVTEGGDAEGIGGQGAFGYKAIAKNGTIGTLELAAGKPALRLKGAAQLIPINIHTEVLDIGIPGVNALSFAFVPASAEGRLTLEKAENEGKGKLEPGRSFFTVTPEFQASYLHLNPYAIAAGGVAAAGVTAHVGPSAAVAHDGDGTAVVANPRVGASGYVLFSLTDRNYLDVAGRISYMPSLIPSFTDATMAPALSWGGSVGYNRTLASGNSLFVRAEAAADNYDVKKVDGSSAGSGVGTFFGLTVGAQVK